MKRMVTAIAMLMTVPAQAQQSALPKEVQAAIDAAKKDCGQRVRLKPGFVASKDTNADGVPDYVLDYEIFQCGDMASYFCGSAGCLTQVFASLPDGST
jgi:hypothetical protein